MKEWHLKVIGYLAVLNFISFIVIAWAIGGDALNGKIEHGHYYLNNHGRFTEVSHTIFIYSACHACSVFLGICAAVLIGRAWTGRHPPSQK